MSRKEIQSRRQAQKRRQKLATGILLAVGGLFLVAVVLLVMRGNPGSQPLAAIEVKGAPSLRVDQEQVDLGDVKLGQSVKVSFLLTNVGDQPLKFSEQPYIEVVEGC